MFSMFFAVINLLTKNPFTSQNLAELLPPPPVPKHNSSNLNSETNPPKSPSAVKNFTIKLRNSFSKGTNYFRLTTDKRKSIDANAKCSSSDHCPMTDALFHLRTAPSMIELSDIYMLQLNNQMTYQREIRSQLKKAIDFCRNMKEFRCSTELVEAERLMLLSHKKELAAKTELIRIDYVGNGMQTNPEKCCGRISITDIVIDLKREAMYDTYFNYFYVCVCTYRDQVQATFGCERGTDDAIHFTNLTNMSFSKLVPDFKIHVEIYVLRLNKATATPSKDDKPVSSPILSPIKMFASLTGNNSATESMWKNKMKIDLDKSRFRLHGTTAITSFSLPSSRYVENRRPNVFGQNRYLVYFGSVTKQFQCLLADKVQLDGSVVIGFNSEIRFKNNGHRGFLSLCVQTIDSETDTSNLQWTKRWSVVDGCKIHFWADPEEQYQQKVSYYPID